MLPCCAHRARYPVPSLATFLYMPVRAPERRYTALSTPYLCLHLPLSRRRAHSRAALFVASFLSPTAQAQACIPTTSGHKTSQPATVTRRQSQRVHICPRRFMLASDPQSTRLSPAGATQTTPETPSGYRAPPYDSEYTTESPPSVVPRRQVSARNQVVPRHAA